MNAKSDGEPVTGLCRTFRRRALATWNLMKDGFRMGVDPSEPALTEINLIEIQKRHPDEVKTVKFTQWDEGTQTGADWEWWLGAQDGWLGLRVQAKRLHPGKMVYETLDHSREGQLQVDILIEDALATGLVPLYCFYNFWDPAQFNPDWRCQSFPRSVRSFGCAVAHARPVRKLIHLKTNGLQDVIGVSMPWHCLVCCPGFAEPEASLPQKARGFIAGMLGDGGTPDRGTGALAVELTPEPPSYVFDILHGKQPRRVPDVGIVSVVTEGLVRD